MGIMISYWSGFPPWDKITFRFSGRAVMLFERIHDFELITLIPMCCLRTLVGLRVQLKLKCRLPVASCIDTFRVLSITTCRGQKF